MSASLGDNANGPTVIRVPSWVEHPLGRYYMYFAHHKGRFIRLAYADSVHGPWKIYEPGVMKVENTAFFRPQPDPVDSPPGAYTHVASPEIYVDDAHRRIVLWVHGVWTEGQKPPLTNDWCEYYGIQGKRVLFGDECGGLVRLVAIDWRWLFGMRK